MYCWEITLQVTDSWFRFGTGLTRVHDRPLARLRQLLLDAFDEDPFFFVPRPCYRNKSSATEHTMGTWRKHEWSCSVAACVLARAFEFVRFSISNPHKIYEFALAVHLLKIDEKTFFSERAT